MINKLKSLSVFFPIYNEEQNIPLFIKEAQLVLPKVAKKYEIIIVDDGSTDNSLKIANKYEKEYSNIKVVRHQKNQGYGAALKTGIKNTSHKWVFYTDGDLQFDIAQIEKFTKYVSDFKVIIGYRANRDEGGFRSFNAWLWKIYIGLLYRVGVKDIDCAFKLLDGELIRSLDLISSGAFLSTEILYKLKKRGLKFMQIPVEHKPRIYGEPTGANIKVILRALKDSLLLYLRIKFNNHHSKP